MPSIPYAELDALQREAYEQALVESHDVRIRVTLMDMDERPLFVADDSSPVGVVDGQVDADAAGVPSRKLSLSLLDAGGTVAIDPDAPASGLWLNRMIKVDYLIRVPDLDEAAEWVRVPIFTGPVVRAARAREYVQLEAEGKEVLFPAALAPTRTFSRTAALGTDPDPVDAIREVLAAFGEARFRLDHSLELRAPRFSRFSGVFGGDVWRRVQQLARTLQASAYYDGDGVLVLTRLQREPYPRWTWREGESLLAVPSVQLSRERLVNAYVITTGNFRWAVARLAPEHPLSPESLGRAGAPLVLEQTEDYPDGMTVELAESLAAQRLRSVELGSIDAQFTALVVPHLEPGDVVAVEFGGRTETFALQKFSIGLNASGQMTVNQDPRPLTSPANPIVQGLAPTGWYSAEGRVVVPEPPRPSESIDPEVLSRLRRLWESGWRRT